MYWLRKEGKNMDIEIMMNPDKYGYIEYPHCNGYGSSPKDPEGVNRCTRCDGTGLIRI
jgi:DnaJ-class molecular chaperone